MLSLSGATAPQETAPQHRTPWPTAGGIRPSQEGASTGGDDGQTPPASSAASATKRTLDSSDKVVAKQEALTEKSNKNPKRWSRGIDADAPNAGTELTTDPRERKDGSRSGESPRLFPESCSSPLLTCSLRAEFHRGLDDRVSRYYAKCL